jgi:pyruvate/2-oxoglutarate/acetoin dehydrogenase E1 component
MSEAATLAMATGLALAGKSVVVELVDPNGLGRALDAAADLADIAARTERTFAPSVVIRVPGSTDLRALPLPVYIAGRESDAAEQLSQAIERGGVCVLVDDSHPDAPEGLPEAAAGEPVVLREGAKVTVLAVGGASAAALAGAEGLDAHVVEVRGAASLAAAIARTGRVVVVGELPGGLTASLNEAFWSLEAPWVQLPRGSSADAVRTAIHSVLGA